MTDASSAVGSTGAAPAAPIAARKNKGGWIPYLFIGLFFLFLTAFLFAPAVMVLVGAFFGDEGFTLEYVSQLFRAHYLNTYATTAELSLVTALIGAVAGIVTAYIVQMRGTPRWLKNTVSSFSGVAANFAGVPLAFAFISTLGTQGLLTLWLKATGLDIYAGGFSLFSFTGLVITYLYFQIPLMVIIITPAIEGMRKEWREASSSLGASSWHYWRHIGIPILTPPALAGFILLFGGAFAAYATPYALTSGLVPLVPTEIGNLLSGNVIAAPQLGHALALGMIVVMAVAMTLYAILQKWTGRWQKQ